MILLSSPVQERDHTNSETSGSLRGFTSLLISVIIIVPDNPTTVWRDIDLISIYNLMDILVNFFSQRGKPVYSAPETPTPPLSPIWGKHIVSRWRHLVRIERSRDQMHAIP